MATPVEMPKLGNTVEECIVAAWRKRKGDLVSAGEIIAEIETDKATFEVTAPVGGTLLETFFEEGALVPVFTNLFVIGEAGENVESFRPAQNRSATIAARKDSVEAQTAVAESHASLSGPTPSGLLSPRARRYAEEHRFYPASIVGSGPWGRVLEEDLRREFYSPVKLPSRGKESVQPVQPVAVTPTAPTPAPRASNLREKIARRMRESLATTAQYTLNTSADAAGLLALRAKIKSSKDLRFITINDLVTFCTIKALLEVPALNAEYFDGRIVKHSDVHIGFACDTPRGLMVPVVRNAHQLDIADLATQMKDLAADAIQGTILPDNLTGATFTMSNLGSLGIESFTPLLNPPQVAILGVDAIQVKPARKQGQIEFIDAIGFSLTCDHQVIDGAPGARFLQVLKKKIEDVESLCTI